MRAALLVVMLAEMFVLYTQGNLFDKLNAQIAHQNDLVAVLRSMVPEAIAGAEKLLDVREGV